MGIPDTPVRAPSGAWRRLRRQFLLATSMLGLTVGVFAATTIRVRCLMRPHK